MHGAKGGFRTVPRKHVYHRKIYADRGAHVPNGTDHATQGLSFNSRALKLLREVY